MAILTAAQRGCWPDSLQHRITTAAATGRIVWKGGNSVVVLAVGDRPNFRNVVVLAVGVRPNLRNVVVLAVGVRPNWRNVVVLAVGVRPNLRNVVVLAVGVRPNFRNEGVTISFDQCRLPLPVGSYLLNVAHA